MAAMCVPSMMIEWGKFVSLIRTCGIVNGLHILAVAVGLWEEEDTHGIRDYSVPILLLK